MSGTESGEWKCHGFRVYKKQILWVSSSCGKSCFISLHYFDIFCQLEMSYKYSIRIFLALFFVMHAPRIYIRLYSYSVKHLLKIFISTCMLILQSQLDMSVFFAFTECTETSSLWHGKGIHKACATGMYVYVYVHVGVKAQGRIRPRRKSEMLTNPLWNHIP